MSLTIWFLNVGYGDAIYAEAARPGRDPFRMLMDGGSAVRADRVCGFLAERGVRSLDLMVATHLHEDHTAGLACVARSLERVDWFWGVCRLPADAGPLALDAGWAYYTRKTGESLNAYRELLTEQLPRLGARVLTADGGGLTPGLVQEFSPGIRLELLYTGGDQTAGTVEQVGRLYREPSRVRENLETIDGMANEACLAVRISAYGATALLPGDNLLGWWRGMPADHLQADLLKLTHHGAADGTSPELVGLVQPKAAVVSVGLDRADRPEPDVLKALGPIPLYRTESTPGGRFAAARWTEHLDLQITAE